MVIFYSYVVVYQRVNDVKLALTDANTRKLMWKLPLPAFCQVNQWLSGVKTFWKHMWYYKIPFQEVFWLVFADLWKMPFCITYHLVI